MIFYFFLISIKRLPYTCVNVDFFLVYTEEHFIFENIILVKHSVEGI